MIRKKLLALGVSAVAVTAVVGAGFAGWIFESEAKKEQKLGVNITAAYSFGSVSVADTEPDTVVLDQSGITLLKGNTAGTQVVATWTVNTASYTDAGAHITYAANVYVKGTLDDAGTTDTDEASGLAKYVNCGTATAAATSAKSGYVQYTISITPAEGDITTSDGNTVVTLTLANPLDYTSSKPTSFSAYQAMVAAITEGTANSVVTNNVVTDKDYTVAATGAPVIIEFVVKRTSD